MRATVFLALLSHPARAGLAIAPQERPVMGAPLHLSMHTGDEAAVRALDAAMRAEWDERYAYAQGPASGWERARLSRRMVEDGYLAAVVEREVQLSAEEPAGVEFVHPDGSECPDCGAHPQRDAMHVPGCIGTAW